MNIKIKNLIAEHGLPNKLSVFKKSDLGEPTRSIEGEISAKDITEYLETAWVDQIRLMWITDHPDYWMPPHTILKIKRRGKTWSYDQDHPYF